MKRNILTSIMLSIAVMPAVADSEVVVCANNATTDNTTLSLPQGKLQGTADGGVKFTIKGDFSGYCLLEMNRMSKLIYVEDGGRLTITRNTVSKSFDFDGKGAPENRYLTAHELERITIPDNAKTSHALNDSLQSRTARLDAEQGLTPSFRRLESLRQRYAVLNAYYRQLGWDNTVLPPLATWLDEHPSLWKAQSYCSFFLDALWTMGKREGGEAIHDYTKAELCYAADKIADATLRDAVMHHVMTTYMSRRGANDADDLMPIYLSKAVNQELRSDVEREYGLWEKVKRGSRIPDFSFTDTEGKTVKLSDFRGRHVLIDCWATWCGPCKIQLPHLEKVIARYKDSAIVFMGLSSDKKREAWLRMVCERNMRGVQVNEPDADAAFFKLFRVNAIPRFILLAPDGTVQDSHLPRPSEPALVELLDNLLD